MSNKKRISRGEKMRRLKDDVFAHQFEYRELANAWEKVFQWLVAHPFRLLAAKYLGMKIDYKEIFKKLNSSQNAEEESN